MDDGVTGLLVHAVAVSGKFELGKAYQLTSLRDLEGLGIDSQSVGANARVYATVKQFYAEAPEGTYLWLMGVANTVSIADMTDKTKNHAPALLSAANGEIRVLAVVTVADGSATVTHGVADTVYAAATHLQALAEEWTANHYAPMLCVVEGQNYSGDASALTDLTSKTDNRVCIVIGDNVADSKQAAVGLVAGRIASIPVQRSIARVKDGAISADVMYLGNVPAEQGMPAAIHDKGYICPRTFVGKSGYFWSDDRLSTSPSDDYATIANRRVVDKAYRIAYAKLVEVLSDEVPVTAAGTILPSYASSVEADVVVAVANSMAGNLGTDPDDPSDLGVQCVVDTRENIVATGKFNVALRVKPWGYAKYIDVTIGFMSN